MNMEAKADSLSKKPLAINPKRFILWLFIVTIVMLFAALTSAYLVRKADGNWTLFKLPSLLWITSGIIIASSIAMEWSYWNAKKDNLKIVKTGLVGTLILGIGFLIGQYLSWQQLISNKIFLVGNPSGSFLYVLTGLHAFHLITGIIFLIIVLISALKFRVHSKQILSIQLCRTYWHFLGILWIYLFIFLLINH